MEGRQTRSKAKAGTSKITSNRPVTTSKSRRHVEAKKLNKKQRTEEQNVCELNQQEQIVEQSGEEHNVEEQHIAQISYYTLKKPCNLVTTSERSRRVKARKPNENQGTAKELNVKEKNEEQNIEELNVEEQHAAYTSFDNSKRPCNRVTGAERSICVKARKLDRKRARERNVNKIYVEKQNVEQNIEGQKTEKHIAEELHTACISLDNSKRPCNRVTEAERSICVKARKLDRKRARERNVNKIYVEKQNVEQNIEGQKTEKHIAEELHTACISLDNSKRPCNRVTEAERSICVKARKLDRKRARERNVNKIYVEKQNVEQNIEGQKTEKHIAEELHTACISLASKKSRDSVTVSKRSRRVKARKLNREQRTEEQNVEEGNADRQNVKEKNLKEHNFKEQLTCGDVGTSARHNAQTSCGIMELEQHNEEPNSSTLQTVKTKKRGPTTGKKYRTQEPKYIEWSDNGKPIGKWANSYKAYIGEASRSKIDINIKSWDDVSIGLKDTIWENVKTEYHLDEKMKHIVLRNVCERWKDFKSRLVGGWITKTRKLPEDHKEPYEFYDGITKPQWEIFKKNCETEEFKRKSEKARKNRACNEHPHYLGQAGYAGKKAKWIAEGYSSSTTLPSGPVLDRSIDWILARSKKGVDGNYAIPNEKTKIIADKINDWREKAIEGTWVPNRHDDVLSRALEKKEHPGRVRGIGGMVGIKNVFGKEEKNKGRSGVISADQLHLITQEIEAKVRQKFESMVDAKVEQKFADMLNKMGMHMSNNAVIDNLPSVERRTSCQSLQSTTGH